MRFSLRSVFAVSVLLAFVCTLLFSTPSAFTVSLILFLSIAVPAALSAGTIYTRGYSRAFCIGGLFPSGILFFTTGQLFINWFARGKGFYLSVPGWLHFCETIETSYRVYAAVSWAMIPIVGIVVIAVRYFALKGG